MGITILIVVIGLSLLILGHEAGHFFAAKYFGLKVEEFGFGFPPRLFSRQKGETRYSLNWLPFGGFVKIAGENGEFGDTIQPDEIPESERARYFFSQPAWRRSLILLAGVGVNFILGWFLLSFVLLVGTPFSIHVTDVFSGSPAAAVGIVQGDSIEGFSSVDDFTAFVDRNRGKEVELSVRRGGELFMISVTPRASIPEGEGAIGIAFQEVGSPRLGLIRALLVGFERALLVSWFTLVAFGQLIAELLTQGRLLEDVVGPVGIPILAHQISSFGVIFLIQLIGIISLNLAVINLLPLPALDGGRFFMVLIEKIKGSPISRKTEALVNGIGFLFLISLMVLITIKDIGRWFS